VTGCATTSSDKSITIVEQGSFFVGGRKVQAPGTTIQPNRRRARMKARRSAWIRCTSSTRFR
jgi:hypothetical protein